MFDSAEDIHALTRLLEQRQASLWHACQLEDFRSYLQIRGVPSRQRLERERQSFTAFDSDSQDRTNGVWDKVFFNLGDLGRPFGWGMRATPNIYGPIALQVHPQALIHASDVAVCLRSAAGPGFDRSSESLASADDVDQLYSYPVEAGFPRTTYVKHGESLQDVPDTKDARAPEVSCSVAYPSATAMDVIPLELLVVIWVDPIEIDGRSLLREVRQSLADSGLDVPVHERSMTTERHSVLSDIVNELQHGPVPIRLLSGRHGVSKVTRDWAGGVRELGLDWLWDRYSRYLVEGTLQAVKGGDDGDTALTAGAKPPLSSAPRPTRVAEILNGLKEQ